MAERMKMVWSRKACDQLRRLPKPIQRGLVSEIDKLSRGVPPHVRRTIGGTEYRFHAGDYGVFFDLQDGALRILHIAGPPALPLVR